MISNIPHIQPGFDVRNIRSNLNQMRRAIAPIGQISPGRGIGVNQTTRGTTIFGTEFRHAILPPNVVAMFIGIVTDNAAFDERFKYAWSEGEFIDDSIQVRPDGRSGTTTEKYALAMAEVFETSNFKGGAHVTATDYPPGFGRRPIGGAGTDDTHQYDVPVIMLEVSRPSGLAYWIQTVLGSHDGSCT